MNCSENELRYISKGRPQKFSFCLLVGCSKFLDRFHGNACDTCI